MRQTLIGPQPLKRRGRPKKETPASTPDPSSFDPYDNKPIRDDENKPTCLSMPVQKLTRLQHDIGRGMMPATASQDPVYASFVESLPLDELKFALTRSDSPKALAFLTSLADPTKAHKDITTLAKLHNIGLTEMMQIWRQHRLVKALGVFIDATPVIAEHVVEDAKSTISCCTRCDGAGTIKVLREEGMVWITCVTCEGTGAIRKLGDAKSREYIFHATGMIKAAAGLVVNLTNNSTNVESVLDDLERVPLVVPVSSIEIPADDS